MTLQIFLSFIAVLNSVHAIPFTYMFSSGVGGGALGVETLCKLPEMCKINPIKNDFSYLLPPPSPTLITLQKSILDAPVFVNLNLNGTVTTHNCCNYRSVYDNVHSY